MRPLPALLVSSEWTVFGKFVISESFGCVLLGVCTPARHTTVILPQVRSRTPPYISEPALLPLPTSLVLTGARRDDVVAAIGFESACATDYPADGCRSPPPSTMRGGAVGTPHRSNKSSSVLSSSPNRRRCAKLDVFPDFSRPALSTQSRCLVSIDQSRRTLASLCKQIEDPGPPLPRPPRPTRCGLASSERSTCVSVLGLVTTLAVHSPLYLRTTAGDGPCPKSPFAPRASRIARSPPPPSPLLCSLDTVSLCRCDGRTHRLPVRSC